MSYRMAWLMTARVLKWTLAILWLITLSACGGDHSIGLKVPSRDTGGVAETRTSALIGTEPARILTPTSWSDRLPSPTASLPSASTPAPTNTRGPTRTPSPTPTSTSMPTETPTQTASPTPTSAPQNPLSIEYMRQQSYPGSEITVEETLEPGTNYDRYIASYLSDGFRIYALLTVPRGQEPEGGWPVILFNHGYIPPEQYRTTERYVAYVDSIARNGYIVFRSDYRGHGRSEGEASNGYASADYTIDVLNAVEALKSFPDADPDRIGMWGHSMGGGIALRAMVTTPDVKAGVLWAGTVASFSDLLQRRWGSDADSDSPLPTLAPDSPRWRWVNDMLETQGSPEENPAFYAAISPNTYLADLSGPIQLHHGTADASVPVEYSELLAQQIQAAGGNVELYTYEGDNHNISANFGRAMTRSIRFFDTHVKGEAGE